MINASDYVIFYYDRNYRLANETLGERRSGTKIAYEYAMKKKELSVINILEVKICGQIKK